MRDEFSKLEAAGNSGASDAAAGGVAGAADLSLKPGQTIRINLSSVSGVGGFTMGLASVCTAHHNMSGFVVNCC
jgi:hypothetical protein